MENKKEQNIVRFLPSQKQFKPNIYKDNNKAERSKTKAASKLVNLKKWALLFREYLK